MIGMFMMAVEAPIVLPYSVHIVLLKEWLHKAIATIMIRPGHLAIEARVEVREHFLHSAKSLRAIFLMMLRWKLVTPGTSSVVYSRGCRRKLYVLFLDRLNQEESVSIQIGDHICHIC